MMLGIADVPVEIISKIKSRVNRRANRASSSPSTSGSIPDLGPANQRPESAGSQHTNLTEGSTIDDTDSNRSENDGHHHEDGVAEQDLANPDHVEHNINICSAAKAKHIHLVNPKDRATNKAIEKVEQGASNFAITVMRPPMDLILSLARGCHNAPKSYGDDTVRPLPKVNNFKSGVATAGTQFGLGWYDGITGVATQPYHGAAKHGAKGFLIGIGKGVNGLIFKPFSGRQFR
jgi:hypothetical protein